MKRIPFLALTSLLGLSFLACKKPPNRNNGKYQQSGVDAASSGDITELEEASDPLPPAQEQLKFSLAAFIKEKPELETLNGYLSPDVSRLIIGDKDKIQLETNMSLNLEVNTDELEGSKRQIVGNYFIAGHIFGKQIKNPISETASSSLVEIGATANLDQLGYEFYLRYLGDDVYSGSRTDGVDTHFVRDIEREVGPSIGIAEAKVAAKLATEIHMKAGFGLSRGGTLNMKFAPNVTVTATASGGANILGVGAAAEGSIKVLQTNVFGNANIGYISDSNVFFADIAIDGGTFNTLDGKIELVGSVLGARKAQDIYNPKPLAVKEMPTYEKSFMMFRSKPKAKESCTRYSDYASLLFDDHIAELTRFIEATSKDQHKALKLSAANLTLLKTGFLDKCMAL